MKLCCGFCGNDFPEGAMRFNGDGEWLCETCAVDASAKRKLADAVRLTADAVLAAADELLAPGASAAQITVTGRVDYSKRALAKLALAVLAHRKAKAEQQEAAVADNEAMLTRDGLLVEGNPDAEFWSRFWDLRGIGEYPCRVCNGTGRRTYSNTATYFGGIGGQALTNAECNRCWGTGDDERHGANLKELHLAARAARKESPRG